VDEVSIQVKQGEIGRLAWTKTVLVRQQHSYDSRMIRPNAWQSIYDDAGIT